MATEEPEFTVIFQEDNFEIREYEPRIIVHVQTIGDFDDASSRGFKMLADFIFGNNTIDNTSIKINIKYRFVSKETGTRWSFETNKPKSILVGNPAYGLDPYRECRSSNFLESVLTETITKNHSHIK